MPMSDLFSRRVHFKPYEYPHLLKYKEAIRQSYWVHDEFNFASDVQDYKVHCTPTERNAIKNTMLAIAQIEVSVKTFWSKIYDRMPKSEVAQVGMSFSECHKEGTEILTTEGWMDFRDVTADTHVAQVDPETSELTFTRPQRIIDKPYEGDLYVVDQRTRKFAVTPGHRFLYQTDAGYIREREINDISMFTSSMGLPLTVKFDEDVTSALTPKDKLRIALQADGSARYYRDTDGNRVRRGLSSGCHTYEIAVKKDRKKKRLLGILPQLDLQYREFEDSREGYRKYEVDVPKDWGDLKTFDWVDLSDANAVWCRSFVEELGLWDGCVVEGPANYKTVFMKYSTTEKACADKVQAVGVLAGYYTNLGTYVDERKESYKDVYDVSFAKRERFSSITATPVTQQYNGRVYCVTVPTGCIVTRYEDTVLISGNSEVRHSDAYAHLLELLGLNEEFERIHHIPEIRDRIRYLDKYVGGEGQSDKDYMITVMLFSLFVEYVSLFSQFLIMMSFDKYKKQFKGICNAVEATSKEEELHALFGIELINICREEHPEWFDGSFEADAYRACKKAFDAEQGVLDWIFEDGQLEHLPRDVVDAYLKDKFNDALEQVGLSPMFDIDEALLAETDWFREEVLTTKDNDFFQKRGTAYSKMTQSVTADDLF